MTSPNLSVLHGGEPATTNNRMELTAVIEGLAALSRPCHVRLFTDSLYVQRASASGYTTGNGVAGARPTKSR